MLCTDCRKEVKPVVAVDIDGTIGKYHEHFLKFAEVYMDRVDDLRGPDQPFQYDGAILFREWFCEYYNVSVDVFREIKLAYRQGGQKRSMPKYDYASGMIREFREAGAEVWMTTTRPYLRLDNVDPDTREWLRRNGIEFDGLIYDKSKYAILRDRVGAERVVAVIEDLTQYVEEASQCFHWEKVVWRRTPYNSGLGAGGESSLSKITGLVVPKIKTWRIENA